MIKPGRLSLRAMARCLVLACGLIALTGHADEPTEVGQLLRDGKLTEAQARLDRYLAAKPRDPQLRLLKGVVQRELGRNGDALATFTRLSEDHPDLPEPYNNLAVIYASQGQYDKARVALEKALRTNPSYATAHDNLSDIYAKLASQAYGKALQIDTSSAPPAPAKLALIRDLATTPVSQLRPVLAAAGPAPVEPPVHAAAKPAVTVAAPTSTPAPPPAPAVKPPAAPAPPLAVASAPAQIAATTSQAADGSREVEQAVRAWAQAWADRNMTLYLGAYSKDFQTPGNVPRDNWEQDRRQRITGKSRITVNLLELQITVKGNHAVAKFRQDYKADALAVLSRKTLELSKTGERWLIVKEASGG